MAANLEKDKEVATSVEESEEPVSPGSNSSGSIFDASDRGDAESFKSNQLRPTISSASSTNAIGGVTPSLKRTTTNKTTSTNADPAFEIDFDDDDPGNPQNWPMWYKGLIIGIMSYSTTCIVLYSTSYTSAIPGLENAFGISTTEGVLGMTTYMLGIATGAVVLAPLSEMYGRRIIYIMALGLFLLFVLPSALAQNINTILVTRFFGAFCASSLISNAPGSVNDIVSEEYRALAFSIWSIGPINGPVIGPVVGGFVYQYLDWRWTNWVVLIAGAVGWVTVSLIKETYTPTILRQRAKRKRKETGDERYFSRFDEKQGFWPLLRENLSRPFVMMVTEPICIFWDVYIALIYGILYLSFVAYPIVFSDLRGWTPGFTGLSFCGIAVGSTIVIVCEPLIRKVINSRKIDPETGEKAPESMVYVVCLAAILIPTGEIWFAWTCYPVSIPWIVPILAGIPFGCGNALVFIYASAYLVHSYDIYAASALAGNAVLRSVMGATVPLAAPAMYAALGPNWSGTLLGLLEAACIPIPFVFYRYGHKIRERSTLIRRMRENKERMEKKRMKAEQKMVERAEAEIYEGGPMQTSAAIAEEKDLEKG